MWVSVEGGRGADIRKGGRIRRLGHHRRDVRVPPFQMGLTSIRNFLEKNIWNAILCCSVKENNKTKEEVPPNPQLIHTLWLPGASGNSAPGPANHMQAFPDFLGNQQGHFFLLP